MAGTVKGALRAQFQAPVFLPGYTGELPKGDVYRTRRTSSYTKGKLADYRRWETLKNEVTHIQVKPDGTQLHFLKSFALESWYIEVKPAATAA